jgi:UDP-N-acetylglucosamine/UDP-N-acetylgalactosamine 4-epimerase
VKRTYADALQRIRNRSRTWLVTGAAGFIGSNIAESLLKLDQAVVALDNFSTGKRANLTHIRTAVGEARWRRFRFIEGDIRSLATCREACRGVEAVLHQAALGSVPRSIDDPIASHDSNVNGFLNMLVAARDAGIKHFVYASSSAVYGDDPGLPKVEASIGRSMSPYGLTKHVDELMAGVFQVCYGFNSIGLRYFNVFGPRQDPFGAYPSVIPAWIGALLLGRPAYINGDGSVVRDFCYVDNVVQANLLAAMTDDAAALNQAYNVGHGDQITLNELYEMMRALLAKRDPRLGAARPVYREPRRGDLKYSRADIAKAKRLLGFDPELRLAAGLERTIDWYADNLPQSEEERRVVNV